MDPVTSSPSKARSASLGTDTVTNPILITSAMTITVKTTPPHAASTTISTPTVCSVGDSAGLEGGLGLTPNEWSGMV
eukprot:COSAG01_NODE_8427_length_2787_cov_29.997396_2_plen_77_part_00